jgi:hypothetical protein
MTLSRILAKYASLLLGLLVCLGAPACGTSSELYVTKPLTSKFKQGSSVTVVATGNGVELSKAAAQFKKMLVRRLEKRGIFDQIGTDGDIRIRATIQNMDRGTHAGRGLTLKGKAKVTVEVKVTKSNGETLAHITAQAESQREDDEDRPERRALQAAADEVVGYLEEHGGSERKGKDDADDKDG